MESSADRVKGAANVDPQVVATPEGFEVRMGARAFGGGDGKPVRATTRALAHGIAADIHRVGRTATLRQVPLAQLCLLATDVEAHRDAMVDTLARYADTDLICYRVETPETLRVLQHAGWQPLAEWAERRFGARLRVTAGLMPVPQSDEAIAPLRAAVAGRTDTELVALRAAVGATGSLVVALAWLEQEIDSQRAWELGNLDERYQIERWGADPEAVAALEARRLELLNAERFLELSRLEGST